MIKSHRTRKHQFNAFKREFISDAELKLTPRQTKLLHALVRNVAMCAAIEERFRTNHILGESTAEGRVKIYDEIRKIGVLQVLGYEATRDFAKRTVKKAK